MRVGFIMLRLLGVVGVVAAVIGQLTTSLAYWREVGVRDIGVSTINFFSFFTVQSNIIGAVALAIGVVILMRSRRVEPRWFSVLRVCATSYLATTGVVYNLLLRGIDLPQGATLPWSNEVLHVIVPLIMVFDWLFAPGRHTLSWNVIGVVVIYPIVWAVFTMVRGPFIFSDAMQRMGWYPYPFLDPANGGYPSVALYALLIATVMAGAGAGAIAISRGGRRRKG